MYLSFLDIEKAYDSEGGDRLWEVLRGEGYSQKLVNTIKSLYKETRDRSTLGNIETDWVRNRRGSGNDSKPGRL